MTKENREKLYAHYKDLAENYEAPTHLNSGPTATSAVRKNAKEHVEAMLLKNPELEKPKEHVEAMLLKNPELEKPKEVVEEKKKSKISKKKRVV